MVVVGSQGALQSFQVMLSRLHATFPSAIVFDLHRRESWGFTEQLLARRGPLRVRAASRGLGLDPATVYIAPHDQQLTIARNGLMRISERADRWGHPFADALLQSAARALGSRLIAVVLSGRLEKGADGVREVKHRGGRVIVEDPLTAAAASMPNAALATGCVDFALPPDALGDALVTMCAALGAAELFRVRLNAAVTATSVR